MQRRGRDLRKPVTRLKPLKILDNVVNIPGLGALGNDGRHTSASSELCGHNFSAHTTGSESGAGGRDISFQQGNVGYDFDGLGVWICSWVGSVKTVDVGHQE